MSKGLNRALKITSWVIVGVVLLLVILLVGVKLLGLNVYSVLSGSMEPDIPTGSIIYVTSVDTDRLKAGDVITFKIPGGTATHRIIQLVPDQHQPDLVRFRTQGDSNEMPDGGLVDPSAVIGTPVASIPLLGYVATYIQQPPGSYVAIAVSIALIAAVIIIDTVTDDKKKKADKGGRSRQPK